MKILFAVISVLSLTFAANASDSWDTCTSADGSFQISYGELVLPVKGPEENYVLGKLVKSVLLKTRYEKCMLQSSQYEVVALDEETSYEVYEMNIGDGNAPFEVEFLCNRGGSGIPAADSCKPGSNIKETYHVN